MSLQPKCTAGRCQVVVEFLVDRAQLKMFPLNMPWSVPYLFSRTWVRECEIISVNYPFYGNWDKNLPVWQIRIDAFNINYVLKQVKRDLPKRASLDSAFEASDRKSSFVHNAEFSINLSPVSEGLRPFFRCLERWQIQWFQQGCIARKYRPLTVELFVGAV